MKTVIHDVTGKAIRTDKRENTAAWKKVRATVIREEDVCWLCHKPVDKDLKWPDKQCAVVDHIVPFVDGGTDDRENLHMAHNSCNLKKGKKDANEVRVMNHSRVW